MNPLRQLLWPEPADDIGLGFTSEYRKAFRAGFDAAINRAVSRIGYMPLRRRLRLAWAILRHRREAS